MIISRFIAITFAICFSVNAYSQVPFECNDHFYQSFNPTGTQLMVLDYNVLTNTFVVSPNSFVGNVSAVGYRITDNFAYGINMSGGITLVQISADGSAIDLGPIAGLPGNVTNYPGGDFGADGLLYIDPTGAKIGFMGLTSMQSQ